MGTPSAAHGDELLPAGVRPLRASDPTELGRHTLVGRLGSGGMGVVYLGRDPLGGLVAVKSAHPDSADEALARRFAAEADCLRRVPSSCTARLIKDGTARTPPYIITEYVEGRSLAYVVDTGGPLPPEQVRAFATGALRALAAIHRAGLIHRDLKPPNILLTVSGPRVIDFGIAHEVGASGGPTGPETVVGSPGWIPPERLRRDPATPASDVFGWGCLTAYAATGRNPFGRGDADALARRILTEPPDLDGIEEPLRGLVAEALVKEPPARPSAEELLARLGGGGVVARRTPSAVALRDEVLDAVSDRVPDEVPEAGSGTRVAHAPARRRRWPALAGAGVTAAAVLTAVVVTRGADHDVARTPRSGPPSASPSDDGAAIRATHRVRAVRSRAARPGTRPSPSSGRPSTRPSASKPPVTVPTILDPSLPVVRRKHKGRGKGGGPANGSASDDPAGGPP